MRNAPSVFCGVSQHTRHGIALALPLELDHLVYFLVYNNMMIKLNIHEAKTHLSRYLELVEKGECITLCKRNVPIAEIRPIPKPKEGKRPIGTGKGEFHLDERFFEPLPNDLLDRFNGGED